MKKLLSSVLAISVFFGVANAGSYYENITVSNGTDQPYYLRTYIEDGFFLAEGLDKTWLQSYAQHIVKGIAPFANKGDKITLKYYLDQNEEQQAYEVVMKDYVGPGSGTTCQSFIDNYKCILNDKTRDRNAHIVFYKEFETVY